MVVMVAGVVETKCHPYFPTQPSSPQFNFGAFQIELISTSSLTNSYITRLLKVTRTTVQLQLKKKKKMRIPLVCKREGAEDYSVLVEHRYLYHMEYVSWPAEKCPKDLHAFLDFIDAVESITRQASLLHFTNNHHSSLTTHHTTPPHHHTTPPPHYKSPTKSTLFSTSQTYLKIKPSKTHNNTHPPHNNENPPHNNTNPPNNSTTSPHNNKTPPNNNTYLVHCSGGVGRTGVVLFCLLCKKFIDHNTPLHLPSLLSLLRHQRMHLVCNIEHYAFVKQLCQVYIDSSRLI